jgi:hypothetical protein
VARDKHEAPAAPPTEELILRPTADVVVADAINFEEDTRELHVEASDLKYPFLQLLQDGSPLVKKGPRKMPGAEAGMILNTVTKELHNGEVGVPVLTITTSIRRFDEWIPVDDGGGFRGSYLPNHERVRTATPGERRGTLIPADNPEGTELIETAYFFVVFPESMTWAICTMASKKWQSAKTWNTLIAGVRFQGAKGPYIPAPYAVQYRLGTVLTDNKGKEPSYIYTITSEGPVKNAAAYRFAKDFEATLFKKIQSGEEPIRPPEDVDVSDANEDAPTF